MAERSGVAAQFGIAKEEEYGAYKAPTRFLPFESESLTLEKTFIKRPGLRAGRLVQPENLHVATTRTAAGDVSLQLLDQGMGLVIDQLHGETVAPAKIGETAAYKQEHKVGLKSPYGKSLTVQVGRPDTGGTVRPFSYLGAKVMSATISVEANEIATLGLTLDAQDEDTTEALASATYDANAASFHFGQCVVKVDGAEIGNARQTTIEVPIAQSTDRYHLGNEGVKDQPILNELIAIVANSTLEFASLADHERFTKAEVVELSLEATGATIEGENKMKAAFKMPAVKQVSSGPTVQGPDILTTDVTFEVLDDGTNAPLTVELISTDSAL